MTEEKLLELLKDMSLKEKIGQMMQLDVSCFKDEGPVTGSAVEQGMLGQRKSGGFRKGVWKNSPTIFR